ncbi:MAG: SPOR domain-containing protein, partial [Cyclobacteriaceae bacterium]
MVIKVNLALPLFLCALISQGQPSNGSLEGSFTNHVVIGAFSSRDNAVRFTEEAKQNNPDAVFNINPDRKLFYVYVTKTDDRVQAFAEARKLRKESKYWDTWVYYGALGENVVSSNTKKPLPAEAKEKEIADTPEESFTNPPSVAKKDDEAKAAEIKAYSMAEEPTGLDLNKMIGGAQTQAHKDHYEEIKNVKETVVKLNKETKVIVFKDDQEGRQALKALGYEIDEDKPISGFFDSKNNILAINATESKTDEPFHEGLKPVVKFLRKKDPERFESFTKKVKEINHPLRGVTYGEINATGEEALGNMMADVAQGYFENSTSKDEATTLMGEILETLGVESVDIALSGDHLKTTATNLAVAVREATGFDAEGNRKFRFDLFNTMNLKRVAGEVDLVNESGRKISSYASNEVVQVMRSDASGNIILACEVLGYRKLLFKLNYDNPFLTEGVEKGENEEAIVPFGLVRLQKGDIAVMYNVYFFKDAAIMRPESRYEINNLLSMMNENEAYKILIHGHTNGNAAGKIITMSDAKNFFSLTNTEEGRGSAKKLSEERAKVISKYLVDQGIEEG